MTEKHENLVRVHFQIDTLDGFQPGIKSLLKVGNLQDFAFLFFLSNFSWHALVVFGVHVLGLECGLLLVIVGVNRHITDLVYVAFFGAAAHQEETGMLFASVGLGQDELQVQSNEENIEAADSKQPKRIANAEVLVFDSQTSDSTDFVIFNQGPNTVEQGNCGEEPTEDDPLCVKCVLSHEQLLQQGRHEVETCCNRGSFFGFVEDTLCQNQEAEQRLAKEPHKEPHHSTVIPREAVDHEDSPHEGHEDRVRERPLDEPGEPVGEVTHAHHSHGLLGACGLFADHAVDRSEKQWDEGNLHEKAQNRLQDLWEKVDRGRWGLDRHNHNRDLCVGSVGGGFKNGVGDPVLKHRVAILQVLFKVLFQGRFLSRLCRLQFLVGDGLVLFGIKILEK